MKIVFDLDGTICFSGKPLTRAMVQALDALADHGYEIIFASARPIRDLLPVLPEHMHTYSMVGGNGAFAAAGGQLISLTPFDQATKEQLLQLLFHFKADYLLDSSWDYAYTGDDEHPIRRNLDPHGKARNLPYSELTEIVKMVVLRCHDGDRMLSELQQLPVVTYVHGTEDIMDISPRGVDKWSGLQALGLRPQEYIAFGNDANDISMFRHASRSICVGEHAELKRIATHSVKSMEEQVIEKIFSLIPAKSKF